MDDNETRQSDLDHFLKKVENIESVFKALQSSDATEVAKALEFSERLLRQSKPHGGFNLTTVNSKPELADEPIISSNGNEQQTEMQQNEIVHMREEDAQQLAVDRQKRFATASAHKEAGNAAYKLGKYDDALLEYTRAIEVMHDYEVCYTNRALALIELQRFDEALADCNFALQIDERNTKAMFLRAKALAASGQQDAARLQYEAAAQVDPKLNKLVRQRLSELEYSCKLPKSPSAAIQLGLASQQCVTGSNQPTVPQPASCTSQTRSTINGNGNCSNFSDPESASYPQANVAATARADEVLGQKPEVGSTDVEAIVQLLLTLNISSREELGAVGDSAPVSLDRLSQDTFSKRISQLLIDTSPTRNRCDLELLRNAARRSQRAMDVITLLSKLAHVQPDAAVCSEVFRASHYCASRWIDVYSVSALSRGGAALLNLSTSELQSTSAYVIEHALAYLANCMLLIDTSTRLTIADFEPISRAFVEIYLVRLSKLLTHNFNGTTSCQGTHGTAATSPYNLKLLLDRALIVAARAFRFVQVAESPDEQFTKFVSELIDAILRVFDAFVFRSGNNAQPAVKRLEHVGNEHTCGSGPSPCQALFADDMTLNKHALLCLVSAVRLIECDVQALVKLFTSFGHANFVRFSMLCDELITCNDCMTLGNLAVLLQSFIRTKQLFRRCVVDSLLRNDASGLKRLLAVLANDRQLDVTDDWQVCSWFLPQSDNAVESKSHANSKCKQVEQTKINVAILLCKLTQPSVDVESEIFGNSDPDTKLTSSPSHSMNVNTNPTLCLSKSNNTNSTQPTDDEMHGKIRRKEDQEFDHVATALEKDEISSRLTEHFRRLHAFEILHSTLQLLQ